MGGHKKEVANGSPHVFGNVNARGRRSLAGKVDANSAGSALALLVAITVMIVV